MASKKNNAYWAERQKQLTAQLEKDEKKLDKKLAKSYNVQQTRLEREISAFYQTYGQDDVIEYRTLMERISDADRTLLIENMDGFAKKYPEYEHLMPVRENIYKLNRLEGLQQSIYVQQMELGALEQKEIETHLKKAAEKGIDLAGERMGFGKNFHTLNTDTVARTINAKWVNNENFSDRIWGNRKKLAEYLNTDFAQAAARGASYESIRADMAKKFHDISRRRMKDLIYTEGSYVMNESSIAGFEDNYEEYTFDCLNDSRSCEKCRGLHGQTFKIKDRKPGVNFSPMHTKCRCTFLVVIAGEDSAEALQFNEGNGKIDANINRALDDVVAKGKETNTEHLTFLDASTGEYLLPQESGSRSKVVIPPEAMEKLRSSPTDSIVCIHNHPSSSAFSAADIQVASKFNSIKDLLVKGHDGTEYKLNIGTGIRPLETRIEDNYWKLANDFEPKYRGLVTSGKMTAEQAWKEHSNDIVTALAEKYAWKYERTLP